MTRRGALTLMCCGLQAIAVASSLSAETMLCSVQRVVECSSDGDCGPPNFGAMTPATFFLIDTDRRLVTLLAPEKRRGETTEIHSQRKARDGWLIAGTENERSWSIRVSSSGDLTISITMDGAVWNGFGKWMLAEHAKP